MDIGVSEVRDTREDREPNTNRRSALAQDRAQRRDHLYILQSADGLIKVGRSKHPRTRAARLAVQRRCQTVVIGRFPHRGHEEARILIALVEHRESGEWFRDSAALRELIIGLLGDGVKFREKLPRPRRKFQPKRATVDEMLEVWLTAQEARRSRRPSARTIRDDPDA